jgi:hypothetical protein
MTAGAIRAALAAAALCLVLPGCGGHERVSCSAPFDVEAWRDARQPHGGGIADPEAAHRLAEGLERCGTLDGDGREQTRRQLGKPGSLSTVRSTPRNWYYPLGELDNTFNDDYLAVRFDERDRVSEATILRNF